jgi:hypothetical protein
VLGCEAEAAAAASIMRACVRTFFFFFVCVCGGCILVVSYQTKRYISNADKLDAVMSARFSFNCSTACPATLLPFWPPPPSRWSLLA